MKTHRAYCDTCGRAFSWAGSPQTRSGVCPHCGDPLQSYAVAPLRTPIEPVSPQDVRRKERRDALVAIIRGS